MPLTDAKVRSLKAMKVQYKVSDSDGLYILVTSAGGKLWRMAYRFLGKQKSLALGKYPATSLLEARQGRDDARRLLAKGTDPSSAKKAEKRAVRIAAGNTFQSVADEWFEMNADRWVVSYSARLRSRLDADLLPALGDRPIADIAPLEVLDVIRKIEKRDAVEMARRVMHMASGIFRYGVATARCDRDPTADLKGALRPPKAVKHRASLPAAEMTEFMSNLQHYDGDILTSLALKLVAFTFVRTSELRFASWAEIEDLEGPEPLWRISADRMKMRRPHLVPLAPQVVEVLRKLRRITGRTPYLFPAKTKSGVISSPPRSTAKLVLNVRFAPPVQPIDATQAFNLSAGVWSARVSRGPRAR